MDDDMDETRIMEPVPAEDEIRITATNWLDEVAVEEGTLEWPAAEGDGSATASGSTRRASATSSRCPRTRTGRSASSTTTTTGDAPASSTASPAASAVALLAAREQVAVDLGQAGEVVDVLVEVGDADHAPGCAARAARCSMLRRVALGQRLVVGEVLGHPPGQVLVAEPRSPGAAGRSGAVVRAGCSAG